MADTEKRLLLRLPAELHQEVTDLAEQDLRSLNAEILVLLREAIEARHAKQSAS